MPPNRPITTRADIAATRRVPYQRKPAFLAYMRHRKRKLEQQPEAIPRQPDAVRARIPRTKPLQRSRR